MTEDRNEVLEDALDTEEVFLQYKGIPQPPVPASGPFHPPHPQISDSPHIKPEDNDWTEYQIYFDQLAELYGSEDEKKAMVLSVCLKEEEAQMVFAGINAAQLYSYHVVISALVQSFTLQGLVHLYQAVLKARKKKGDESMADLKQDVARLVRLAYSRWLH